MREVISWEQNSLPSIFWKVSSNKLNGTICKVFNNKDTFYIIQIRSIDCKHT